MDWPVTKSYCQSVADHYDVPLYYSYRDGGFLREMLRENQPTAPVYFETPTGLQKRGGNGKPNTRRKFPQVSADLRVRFCSPYLKIAVGDAALRNQERFYNSRTLFVTGERAQESPARSKYAKFEVHRSDARGGRLKRHIDHWRPVHDWKTNDVWDIIKDAKLRAHPGYYMSFGRLSCMSCIFASCNQWATIRHIAPDHFDRIAHYEEQFEVTIQRKRSVRQMADIGVVYAQAINNPELVKLALSKHYDAPIVADPWVLPAGAFGESSGPT
jgi:hypothetical protein